jgi:hypothetical protein
MLAKTSGSARIDVIAAACGFSAALIVLFVLCLIAALLFPNWSVTHAWIGLFSAAPLSSVRVWMAFFTAFCLVV